LVGFLEAGLPAGLPTGDLSYGLQTDQDRMHSIRRDQSPAHLTDSARRFLCSRWIRGLSSRGRTDFLEPLGLVQIDHTLADVIVVGGQTENIGNTRSYRLRLTSRRVRRGLLALDGAAECNRGGAPVDADRTAQLGLPRDSALAYT
jgi:hypothetical protein